MDKEQDVQWKEFRIGDLFNSVVGLQPDRKDRFNVRGNGMVPVITGVTINNGIGFYTTKSGKKTYRNILTVSKDGEYAGTVYLQDEEVFLGGHSLGLIPKAHMDNKVLLFIASRFLCLREQGFWKSNMIPSVQKEKIDNLKILLPAKEDVPEWDYMAERIRELEAERIRELEAERIRELEAYLVASGLDDYELTEADKQVLVKMSTGGGILTRLDVMKTLLGFSGKSLD